MLAGMKNKLKAIGLDGFAMLLLSNLIIVATLGLTLLAILIHVIRVAFTAPTSVTGQRWIIVPGMCLRNDLPNAEFKRRLERARQLFDTAGGGKIILLGGIVGANTVSEAMAGKHYLLELGVPETHIVLEQNSSNTLENFRFAKRDIATTETSAVIVSSRYHLARCGVMAKSLQIEHQLCGAEDQLSWLPGMLLRLLKEAYHLHWYWSGRYWAKATGNEKMLRRLQ